MPFVAAGAAGLLLCGSGVLAGDWPMRLHDVHRSGATDEQLNVADLSRSWVLLNESPDPAWPESPAPHDFWHRYLNLKPRKHFDRCFDVAVVGNRVYYGSSRSGAIRCVSLAGGNTLWTYFTDGPVRFAPQVEGDRVYAGSDDGYVYCLDALTGALQWKVRAGPSDEKMWGNGRMISRWPVRSSVLVQGDEIYWSAGILPEQGMYLCKRSALDGSGGWTRTPVKPHMGYLLATAERLFAPSGKSYPEVYLRDTGSHTASVGGSRDGGCWALLTPSEQRFWFTPRYAGSTHAAVGSDASSGSSIGTVDGANFMVADATHVYYVTDNGVGKIDGSNNGNVWTRPHVYPYAIIKAGNTIFVGGDGAVAGLDAATGDKVWEDDTLDGRVYGLAAANESLLVSTDTGAIYSYGSRAPSVSNGSVSDVTTSSAVLNGSLDSTGQDASAAVFCCWGLNPGGTDLQAWEHVEPLGYSTVTNDFAVPVGGLTADRVYYYRFCATNSVGTGWATDPEVFITGALVLEATDPEAWEEGAAPGVWTVSRPPAAAGAALPVNYRLGGTAGPSDYAPLPGAVTIPAGETSATILLTPVDDDEMNEGDETVTAYLDPGGYVIGSPSQADIIIVDNDSVGAGDFTHNVRLCFDGYAGSETLQAFPVLVVFDESMPDFSHAQAQPGGTDLRFTDDARSMILPHQIEDWDEGGRSYVWVRLPALPPAGTCIRAFWGNEMYTSLPASSTDGTVWSPGFAAVWHLNETSGTIHDSSPGGNHGTVLHGLGHGAPGKIGRAGDFDGIDDSVAIASPSVSIPGLAAWTMEAWIWGNDMAANSYPTVLSYGRWGASLGLALPAYEVEAWINNGDGARSSGTVALQTWTHVAVVFANGQRRFFIDGQPSGVASAPAVGTAHGTDWRMGHGADDGNKAYSRFDGVLDEIRFSAVGRSADWIAAAHACTADNGSFLSFGAIYADVDHDGMEDRWEEDCFGGIGVADETTDFDHDGSLDCEERIAGTDPTDRQSVLRVLLTEMLLPRRLRICWSSVSNRSYRIEAATNLNSGAWSTLAGGLPPTAPMAEHEVADPGDGLKYYRIAVDTNMAH